MHIELDCPRCLRHFVVQLRESESEIWDTSDEPWCALGDGNTFEDMIYAALVERGAVCCSVCGEAVPVTEESLGQLAMEVLAGF
jgi:hypothetical protein